MKAKKEKPFIDYKTAQALKWMHRFILKAYEERRHVYGALGTQIELLTRVRDRLKPVSDDPDYWSFCKDDPRDELTEMRHLAWEAGLTHTLFEKLTKDEDHFQGRFIGWLFPPVSEDEIKERYEWEEDEAEKAAVHEA
ncbi:hypothetical protein AGMMS49944_24070 [Spirochaetia bacterium]|nr:hypothetical protein AGMMS49944_24070 [Spirochaetia bacterium]